jgi:hypothetical protein
VKTVKGEKIKAEPVEWRIEDDGKVKAKIKQVPLRLAWAITIHKSQGMTLDAAEIDLSKSFEKGMGYVALSRVKSLQGLKLLGLNDNALEINEEVLMFDEELREISDKIAHGLRGLDPKDKKEMQEKFLAHISPRGKEKKKKKGDTHLVTRDLIKEKIPLKEIVAKRKLKDETIISHIETLLEKGELDYDDITYLKFGLLKDRLKAIHDAFKKSKGIQLSPVKSLLDYTYTFQEIRLARLFLNKE